MKFNKEYIIIISILGVILLYSYYYYAQKSNVMKLWGNIKGNLLIVYYLSMLLSTIGFLLLFYYLITSNKLTKNQCTQIFIALILIVFVSIFWMPLSLYYLKNKKELIKYLIILVLLIVAMSTLYLIYVLFKIDDRSIENILAKIGMIYFFIHAFFFDSLLWSYNFMIL